MGTLRPIVTAEKNSLHAPSGRKKLKKKRSRKRLAYGVIVVTFILACFLVYFSLHSSPPKVAIVDQLSSISGQSNPAFVDDCKNILEEGGLTWAYHKGSEVTVDFYRNLPSRGTNLIILRVHSAIMKNETGIISILGLFTSERYDPNNIPPEYNEDISYNRLVRAFFTEGGEEYFGIVPEFVEENMIGEFKDTVIVMMGCEGLGYNTTTGERVQYTDMAEAFINKGAKVYIGWNGPVGINHTDQATLDLLQSLILEKQTIKEAVEKVDADPDYQSELKFHPGGAGDYTILNLRSSLIVGVVQASPIAKAPTKTRYQKIISFP